MIEIGDKVVCKVVEWSEESKEKLSAPNGWPENGRVYCVERVFDDPFCGPRISLVGHTLFNKKTGLGFAPNMCSHEGKVLFKKIIPRSEREKQNK